MKNLIWLFLLISCSGRTCFTSKSVIKTVGGCDRYGRCGILLANGESYQIPYPVVGETHEFTKCSYK